MEREFFSLSSKNGAGTTMKEDAANKPKDSVRGSGMQWSFSNKISALPQFLSFKATEEDRQRKTIVNPLASSGYMITSSKDAFFDSDHKPFLGVVQKNLSTIYPQHYFDAHSACHQEARIFSVSNQSNQVSPVLQSSLATAGPNTINSAIKPQPLGSKSSGTPISVFPSIGSIVGSTDLRKCSKSSDTPAQLTIFYAGSVCVYDDISPEKAQAIMLLAGNGSKPIQNMTVSAPKLQPEISIPSKDDGFIISQSYPSPMPGSGPSTSNELTILRSVRSSATPSKHLESPNVVGSVVSAATKMVQSVGLPQARKASLARFLEKRKGRVMTTSPYYMSKKSPECSNLGSNDFSFSINSSDSCP